MFEHCSFPRRKKFIKRKPVFIESLQPVLSIVRPELLINIQIVPMKNLLLIVSLCFFHIHSTYAGGDNIAHQAKITASTFLDANYRPEKVTDGVIGLENNGEWACEGETTSWGHIRLPWIQLTWERPRYIDRIVLYDRPNPLEHTAGALLTFSDGSEIQVNLIPNDGTAKSISFETKKVDWVKISVLDAKGKDIGLSEIEVFPGPEEYTDPVSWVDPYIESNRGRYIFFITGGRPFGLVGAAPVTRNKNQYGGGYNYNETQILGFNQIHDWMISGLDIMPAPQSVNPASPEERAATYSHDDEIVHPGYHRVYLRDHKTWVELTSTDRTAFYRFTYTEDMAAQIIANLGGHISNSRMTNAEVRKANATELEGSFSTVDRFWGGPKDVKLFFVIRFDKPFQSLTGWNEGKVTEKVKASQGDHAGISTLYDVEAGEQIRMKIGMSFTTIENARNNLTTENPGWDFDQVNQETRKIWNEWLGKMEVSGGTQEQKIKFYTDLWHVLLGRHKIDDVSGDYPDRTEGERDGTFTDAVFKIRTLDKDADGYSIHHMYNSDAFWLTQWNLNILWGLAWPEVLDEMSASMVQYAQNGYLLPRGPCGGGYSYIMTGSPSTNMIASAFMKGILTKKDKDIAFQMVKQNLLPGGMLGPEADIEFYTANQFWKDNAGITIEANFQDYSAAQMAKKLGKKEDYQFFINRSKGWKKLYNREQKLLFPLNESGDFVHTDPLNGEGWIEANAWQGTWGISHGIPALAGLMGGKDIFCEKLNYAFEQAEPSDFVFAYTDGYVSYANQPGCSNAHVFSQAGKPWLSQYWVRKVKKQAYGGTNPNQGYGGHDEDQGQMGGVSVLMAIGLFNIQGNVTQTPFYEITSPIFDEIRIKLDNRYYSGKEFVIKTYDNNAKNCYIQKAQLNGEPLNNFWFTHEQFAKGGMLELWLGPKPNKDWGLENSPPVEDE